MSRPEAPTKYRASCDGCYLAKLKCTKEKPTCTRCKNLGLSCTYSPSRRTGKPRASNPDVISSSSTTSTITAPITPPPTTASSSSQVLTWQPVTCSHTGAILPTTTLASPYENSLFAPNNEPRSSLMDTTMSDWSSSATTLHDLDSNLLAPWRNYLPNAEQDDSLFNISDNLVGNNFPAMDPPPTDQQQKRKQKQKQKQALNPTTDGTPSPTCNCFDSITQALHELHDQSRQQRNSTPALEATLSGSKEITARGEQLLNCACATDSSLIMLFAALIAKFLSLYVPPNMDHHLDIPASTSSSSRVTIGKYTMDVQDGERLRMEIILMELQKVKNLLVRVREKVSTTSGGNNSYNDGMDYEGNNDTYDEAVLVDYLNVRLKEAMGRLQRLKQRFQAVG